MQMTGQRIMQDMRRQIFGHLQDLHVGYFDQNPVGRLMTRVTTDVDAVNELFTSGVVTVFGDLFTLFGIMGVMLALELAPGAGDLLGDPVLLRGDLLVPARGAAVVPRGAQVAGAHQRLPAGEPDGDVGGAALPPRGAQQPGLRGGQPRPRRRQPASDLLLRRLLPGDRAAGRRGHRADPALRRRPRAGGGADARGAGGLHPVLASASGGRSRTSRRSSTSCRRRWPPRSGSSCCSTAARGSWRRREPARLPDGRGPRGLRGRLVRLQRRAARCCATSTSASSPARASRWWAPPARARPRSSAC